MTRPARSKLPARTEADFYNDLDRALLHPEQLNRLAPTPLSIDPLSLEGYTVTNYNIFVRLQEQSGMPSQQPITEKLAMGRSSDFARLMQLIPVAATRSRYDTAATDNTVIDPVYDGAELANEQEDDDDDFEETEDEEPF